MKLPTNPSNSEKRTTTKRWFPSFSSHREKHHDHQSVVLAADGVIDKVDLAYACKRTLSTLIMRGSFRTSKMF
jgi:hypothetical protein